MNTLLKEIGYVLMVSIVVAHCIITMGQTDNFFSIVSAPGYPLDLSYVTAISFVVIFSLFKTHQRLDVRFPFLQNIPKRLFHQFIWVVLTPSLITFFLSYAYLVLTLGYDLWATSFMHYEFPAAILVIVICNLFLFLYTVIKFQTNNTRTEPLPEESKSIMLLRQGSVKVPIPYNDIAAVLKDSDLAVVFTFSGKQFSLSESLEECYSKMDPTIFFRANRQMIIHFRVVGQFLVNRSGKIELSLLTPLSREISISQKKAQEFKEWLAAT